MLRNLILDEVLARVQDGRTSREDVEAKFPIEFQRDFFPRLAMLTWGMYKLGYDRIGAYDHHFSDEKNKDGNNKERKLSPSSQLHSRVVELLKFKNGSNPSGGELDTTGHETSSK